MSDIQQECYLKLKEHKELTLYEKASVYSVNLCICVFGWPLSPEATIQQILCTVPTDGTLILHSDYFSNHEKVRALIQKHPNATVKNPARLTWGAEFNEFGLWSAYTFDNGRIALACNGLYLYKERRQVGNIQYPGIHPSPQLPEPTIISPFKFHESPIRHLQDENWLYKPKFKWVLDI